MPGSGPKRLLSVPPSSCESLKLNDSTSIQAVKSTDRFAANRVFIVFLLLTSEGNNLL